MKKPKPPPAAVQIRRLVRTAVTGALATSSAGGGGRAYVSLVTMAASGAGEPLFLLSTLARHSMDIAADSRVSVLIDGTAGHANRQAGPRVTLLGRMVPTADPGHRARFLARHPGARLYADFQDFGFHRLAVERVHFVAGFAAAVWLDARKVLFNARAAQNLAEAEAAILAHMNADHGDAVAAYGNHLLGRRGKHWTMTGIDAEGCDLRCGANIHRLDFDKPVSSAGAARTELVRLAGAAKKIARS